MQSRLDISVYVANYLLCYPATMFSLPAVPAGTIAFQIHASYPIVQIPNL
jgi:hypothetical protein